MSWIVKAGKQGKKIVKKLITPAEKLSPMDRTFGLSFLRKNTATAPIQVEIPASKDSKKAMKI